MSDHTFTVGDFVTWQEGMRHWRGLVVRVGVLHALVKPDDHNADWIAKWRLTRVDPAHATTQDSMAGLTDEAEVMIGWAGSLQ